MFVGLRVPPGFRCVITGLDVRFPLLWFWDLLSFL